MDFQEAVLRNMRAQKEDLHAMADNGNLEAAAAFANCTQQDRQCTVVELPDALRGPAHVARLLVRVCQTRRTAAAPEASPYRLNAEQLQVLAIYVHALDKGFACQEKKEEPWVNPASVLLTIVQAAAITILLACFVLLTIAGCSCLLFSAVSCRLLLLAYATPSHCSCCLLTTSSCCRLLLATPAAYCCWLLRVLLSASCP